MAKNRNDLRREIRFINERNGELIEEGDDIRKEELETIGDFLNCITQQNEFSIKAGAETFKLRDSNRRPSSPDTGGNGAEKFTSQDDSHFETIGESGDFGEFPRKGIDGHEFLKTIKGKPANQFGDLQVETEPDKFQTTKRISNILRKNRFHPGPNTPFIPRGSTSEDIDSTPFAVSQKRLGAHRENTPNITFNDLKKVGLSLMLRATGEFFGSDGDPENLEAGASSLVPGAAQLAATRIDPKSMYAENVFIGDQFKKDDLLTLEQDTALKGSFGSLNNFQEPFGGLHPTGMVALATALVLSLKLVLEGLARLLTIGDQTPEAINQRGPHPIGKRPGSSQGILGRFSFTDLGITNTRHDFSRSFDRGLDVFFSADATGTGFKRVIESPGFYAVLVRSVLRSVNLITEDIGDVAELSSNPFQAAQNVVGVLESIKNSKAISIISIFAQIGDNALELEEQGFIESGLLGDLKLDGLPEKISSIDKLPENPATRIAKVRGRADELKIAWRNSALPSLYVLPEQILKAGNAISNENIKPSNLLTSNDTIVASKITTEQVKQVENELDAEYVPFYFQDLRTNEIISFHAFLASLNETYNANWESSSPYGRVDPVRIYKNTERNLSLEFFAISTNQDDFNQMWRKINKLVSMVYPQWTRGRKVSAENDTFIQPFSQIPSASPVIRMRIGDLIKSNYSRFGLARLFGLGTEDFKVQNTRLSEQVSENREKINKISKRMRTKPFGIDDDNGYKIGDRAFLRPLDKGYEPEFKTNQKLVLQHEAKIEVKDVKFDIVNGVVYLVELINIEMVGPSRDFLGKRFFAFFSDLVFDANEPFRQVIGTGNEDALQEPEPNSFEAIKEFFDPNENAIVRSFESTSGKGLGGVIPSLSFNWHEPLWETSKFGSRAPQWCKISMDFNVIHDLPPGLTDEGFTNGIYNVGDAMRGVMSSPHQDDNGEEFFNLMHSAYPGFLREK